MRVKRENYVANASDIERYEFTELGQNLVNFLMHKNHVVYEDIWTTVQKYIAVYKENGHDISMCENALFMLMYIKMLYNRYWKFYFGLSFEYLFMNGGCYWLTSLLQDRVDDIKFVHHTSKKHCAVQCGGYVLDAKGVKEFIDFEYIDDDKYADIATRYSVNKQIRNVRVAEFFKFLFESTINYGIVDKEHLKYITACGKEIYTLRALMFEEKAKKNAVVTRKEERLRRKECEKPSMGVKIGDTEVVARLEDPIIVAGGKGQERGLEEMKPCKVLIEVDVIGNDIKVAYSATNTVDDDGKASVQSFESKFSANIAPESVGIYAGNVIVKALKLADELDKAEKLQAEQAAIFDERAKARGVKVSGTDSDGAPVPVVVPKTSEDPKPPVRRDELNYRLGESIVPQRKGKGSVEEMYLAGNYMQFAVMGKNVLVGYADGILSQVNTLARIQAVKNMACDKGYRVLKKSGGEKKFVFMIQTCGMDFIKELQTTLNITPLVTVLNSSLPQNRVIKEVIKLHPLLEDIQRFYIECEGDINPSRKGGKEKFNPFDVTRAI